MSFREASLPELPPAALLLYPAGGLPFPQTLCVPPRLQVLAKPLVVWWLGGKINRTGPRCVVYDSCAQ